MLQLNSSYVEAYSQWFDAQDPKMFAEWLKDYEKFVVVDSRETGNVKEREVISCLNFIGSAIHTAINLTKSATREIVPGDPCTLCYDWTKRGRSDEIEDQ